MEGSGRMLYRYQQYHDAKGIVLGKESKLLALRIHRGLRECVFKANGMPLLAVDLSRSFHRGISRLNPNYISGDLDNSIEDLRI